MERVRKVPRASLLTPKTTEVANRPSHGIGFVSTFSPISTAIKEVVTKHWHILQTDTQISNAFQATPRYFYKRSPNLRDAIAKSDISPPKRPMHFMSHIPPGNFPCQNCVHCYAMCKGNHFIHPKSGKTIKIRDRISCHSSFVVYA